MTEETQQRILWPRVLATFLGLESLLYLLYYIFLGQAYPNRTYVILFYSLRVMFIVLAAMFAVIRRTDRYYFPILKEMSAQSYWTWTCVLALSIRVPFLKYFALGGMFDLISSLVIIYFSSTALLSLAISYHQRQWASDYEGQRQLRIEQLRVKSGLSKKELLIVEPVLCNYHEERGGQKKPVSWIAVQFLLSFVIAVIITLVSSSIVGVLSRLPWD